MEISGWTIAGLIVVTLLIVGIGIWLLRRRYKSSGSSGNEDTGEQRDRAYREQRDREIPLRTRAMRTPLEAKVAGVLTLIAVIVVMWEVYSYMKTGSPSQIAAAWQTKFLVGGSVMFAVGIYYDRRRRTRTEGRIDVTYEAQPTEGREERTVTYYYDPRDSVYTDDGPVMYERREQRKFWLFRLPKLHGDDRRFDGATDPRPPGDKIGLELPSHARKVGENHWSFRTKGRIILNSTDGLGDIQWLPPHTKSLEQEMQRSTDIDNLQTRVKELMARNAELEKEQRHRQEGQKNEIDEFLAEMERVVSQVADMLPGNQHVQITEENRPASHSKRDGGTGEDEAFPAPAGSGNGRGGEK